MTTEAIFILGIKIDPIATLNQIRMVPEEEQTQFSNFEEYLREVKRDWVDGPVITVVQRTYDSDDMGDYGVYVALDKYTRERSDEKLSEEDIGSLDRVLNGEVQIEQEILDTLNRYFVLQDSGVFIDYFDTDRRMLEY